MQKVKELTKNENIFFYRQICGILYVLLTDSREETTMQNIIPDERYSVADEAILGAFFKLVKEKKPDRITVSDITKTAGIAEVLFIITIRTSLHLSPQLRIKRFMMFFP